nr:bifunctional hydroxymethylpyrimidine kinase/phosphomethylpyrimidine kinase [Weissella diestrammenae]
MTIAGADIFSGGGVQADLATFNTLGLYGLSVITSIVTIDDEKLAIHPMALDVVKAQLDAIHDVSAIAAVKVGLIPNVDMVQLIAKFLETLNTEVPIVIDPVMIFKEDDKISVEAVKVAYQKWLLPLATVTTPNLPEALLLTGEKVATTTADLERLAEQIMIYGSQAVVVKGGNRLESSQAIDVLVQKNQTKREILQSPKLENQTNTGAGCTYSSAIASQLALGDDVVKAVTTAKQFVQTAIENGIHVAGEFGNVWQGANRNE